jgi:hypothetical protein
MEKKVNQIMTELGMNPESSRAFAWLKEVILMAVDIDTWQSDYLEIIGRREGITRERVRQILHKTVWDNWNANSKTVLENHFGSIELNFEYEKPNHIEFIVLVANELKS